MATCVLAWLPLLLETIMAALLFGLVFHMPALLAIAGGLVLSSVSPEAFMAGMLRLTHKGFGVGSGAWRAATQLAFLAAIDHPCGRDSLM